MSTPSPSPSPSPSPTPLHLAVWDDNIALLSHLLTQPELANCLEAVDGRGNTPLLLAYRMGRTMAARMLLAAGAYSKARTPDGWEAIHISSLTGNPDLVRTSVMAFLRETNDAFERRLPALMSRFEAMPDFTLRMKWELKSWLPLVSSLLPTDEYTIHKRGSSLRLDSTLLGMNGLKWERGNLSLLLWGRDMPQPGSVRVLDWDSKSETDARLAFTHPKDQQIQDWVRKLLTNKQKVTDWWSRDTVMTPLMKGGGLVSGLLSFFGGGGGGGGAGGGAAKGEDAPPLVHRDDPNQAQEEAGVWGLCSCYELKNLCIKDTIRAPILPALELQSWWRPEYSREVGLEQAQEIAKAHAEAAAAAAAAAAGTEREPEKQLAPLLRILRGIRLGKITEDNAALAVQQEGMGFGGGEGGSGSSSGSGSGGTHVSQVTFEAYFGEKRPLATAEQRAAALACNEARVQEALEKEQAAAAAAGSGSGGESKAAAEAVEAAEAAREGSRPHAEHVHGDGRLHLPTGLVAETRAESLTVEEKKLDLKVYFSKAFPITVRPPYFSPHLAHMRERIPPPPPRATPFPHFFPPSIPFAHAAHTLAAA
jgi:hypothetical protein